MKRRALVTGGVALAAAAGGAAWWQSRTGGDGLFGAPELPKVAGPTPEFDFWSLRFEQPGGGELALASLRGRPLLVNFWATWCPPCVVELPLLDAFSRQQQASGWQVVGLAVDSPTPVREFLAQRPLGFPIGLAGLAGADLARRLGNTHGGLPFTVVLDRSGELRHRKLGALQGTDLQQWQASVG